MKEEGNIWLRIINASDLIDTFRDKKNYLGQSGELAAGETRAIYAAESMSSFDDLRKIPSTDYRRFAMEQKSERARHINTPSQRITWQSYLTTTVHPGRWY